MFRVLIIWIAACFGSSVYAQLPRLHVKSSAGSPPAITTGNTITKVIGVHHDGTAGIISATTLDGSDQYTPLKFTTSGLTRLTIYENGFIGIGTTATPTAELTVAGKVHAKEVKVNVAAGTGPDYVFLDSYHLRPLGEVSMYINQHRHLPDVPPAVELEHDGVKLGEMNMLLLKKIEELTLYIIDQNQRTEALELQLQELNQKIEELKSGDCADVKKTIVK